MEVEGAWWRYEGLGGGGRGLVEVGGWVKVSGGGRGWVEVEGWVEVGKAV